MQNVTYRRAVLGLILCIAAGAGCAHKKPLLRWDPLPPAPPLEGAVRVGAVHNLRPPDHGGDNPDLLGYSRNGAGVTPGKQHLDMPYLTTDAESYAASTAEASLRRLVEDSLVAAGIQPHGDHPNVEIAIDLKALWVDGYGSFFGANGAMDVVIFDLQGRELKRVPLKGEGKTSMGWQWTPLEEVLNGFQRDMVAAFREPALREALLDPAAAARKAPAASKAAAAAPAGAADPRARLKQLKQMRDDGLITEEDYQKKKKEILDSM